MSDTVKVTEDGGFAKVYTEPQTRPASVRMTRTSYPLPDQLKARIDPNQLVRVRAMSETSNELVDIEAVLQKPLVVVTAATWRDFPPLSSVGNAFGASPEQQSRASALSGLVKEAAYAVSGVSMISTIGTRRRWTGSTPVRISVDLRFESWNDADEEVLLPAMKLLALPLPNRSGVSLGGVDFFLTPPGPAPYPANLLGKIANVVGSGDVSKLKDIAKSTGEQVTIKFGGVMTMRRCVIVESGVTWDTRCDARGIPLAANVRLVTETFEIMTKESLQEAMLGIER